MGISVLKAGMLTTLQDVGRFGFQKYGMPVSGAMDSLALRLGNMLVGNAETEVALECTLVGPALLFEAGQLISITGGDLSAKLNGKAVPMWKPIAVSEGSTLTFGKAVRGCRSYVCFRGGLAVSQVMGSKATYLAAAIGGWKGRALKKNDFIPFLSIDNRATENVNWRLGSGLYPSNPAKSIRFTEGPHYQDFDDDSRKSFCSDTFLVSKNSNRMGYRLDAPALRLSTPRELLSSAVTFGTVQVPPGGKPIVLMADHPTTGGYPVIGQVIEVDFPLLAQLQPDDRIRFERVTLEQAQHLLRSRSVKMQLLKRSIALKHEK
ncbi:5-oxoprolinase subunit C family protein [Sphingobacterium griseoflavum]|uniref:KipI antagonist n=1 Tax=Sphingobacterium griseoflavum TaxID=1474952 RepID=A0ABQ3I214_9SPHI|nr:biotin-dependent carboxyltransferase family protein [Sphingobacterium griseoflavum]GHE41932.1 KipI antagonist [Sphingobacterium griseoflavum]